MNVNDIDIDDLDDIDEEDPSNIVAACDLFDKIAKEYRL